MLSHWALPNPPTPPQHHILGQAELSWLLDLHFLSFLPLCIVLSVFIIVEKHRQMWWKPPLPAAPYVIMPLKIPGISGTLPDRRPCKLSVCLHFQDNPISSHPSFLHTLSHGSLAASGKYSPITLPLSVANKPTFAFNLHQLICGFFWVYLFSVWC